MCVCKLVRGECGWDLLYSGRVVKGVKEERGWILRTGKASPEEGRTVLGKADISKA